MHNHFVNPIRSPDYRVVGAHNGSVLSPFRTGRKIFNPDNLYTVKRANSAINTIYFDIESLIQPQCNELNVFSFKQCAGVEFSFGNSI